jgi:hypothetical protein
MSSDENTEVNVEVIGGAPEVWVTRSAVIVTTLAVVVLCCGVVVGLGCGVGLWGAGWEVGVGVLLVGRTVDAGGGATVVDGVTVVVGVVGVGVVDTTTGVGEVVGVGVVTKQRKKVWSAIDR